MVAHGSRTDGIVILVPGFPANEAETDCLPPVQNFVKVLAQRNPQIRIDVVSFQYPFKAGNYQWHGATVHAIGGRSRRFPWRLSSWARASWRIFQLMRTRHVIALHSMWLAECTYVAAWISRGSGVKLIATIRGQDALPENPYLRRLPFDRMTVTAGSEPAALAFERSTGRKVNHVIPSGLDVESLNRVSGQADRTIDILGVGSLTAIKDFSSFVAVVAKLREDHSALKVKVLGEGPELAALREQAVRLGLHETIQFDGRVSREQVLRTMQKSKILLHTARYEGQGYVFLEALQSGMRVVCRDVGYSGDGEGVFRCASDKEIVDVLHRLLSAPLKPLQTSVLAMETTVQRFEKLYYALSLSPQTK